MRFDLSIFLTDLMFAVINFEIMVLFAGMLPRPQLCLAVMSETLCTYSYKFKLRITAGISAMVSQMIHGSDQAPVAG